MFARRSLALEGRQACWEYVEEGSGSAERQSEAHEKRVGQDAEEDAADYGMEVASYWSLASSSQIRCHCPCIAVDPFAAGNYYSPDVVD